MRIGSDILRRHGQIRALRELDQSLGCQELKRARFVRRIVRNGDRRSVGDVFQRSGFILARIDAHRLVVNLRHRHEVRSVLLVELIQILLMLEIVRIDRTVLYHRIRHHIIRVFLDLQIYAFLGQLFLELI